LNNPKSFLINSKGLWCLEGICLCGLKRECLKKRLEVIPSYFVDLVKRPENFWFPLKLFYILSFYLAYNSLPNNLQTNYQTLYIQLPKTAFSQKSKASQTDQNKTNVKLTKISAKILLFSKQRIHFQVPQDPYDPLGEWHQRVSPPFTFIQTPFLL
jgi:hypothetical protein